MRSNGFPDVIGGVIDGCQIPCKQPVGNPIDFYDRKGFHSIILQGYYCYYYSIYVSLSCMKRNYKNTKKLLIFFGIFVVFLRTEYMNTHTTKIKLIKMFLEICDYSMKFTDVFIGMPGRMHDARVFRNSPIFRQLLDNELSNYHIIGDSAYPLLLQVMTPYRDNGHLTRKQAAYNRKLSSIRSTIERAFGLLKGKFRRLKYLDISNFDLGQNMIGAACMLHNFMIDQKEINEEMIENIADLNVLDNDERNVEEGRNVEAITKRNNICNMF